MPSRRDAFGVARAHHDARYDCAHAPRWRRRARNPSSDARVVFRSSHSHRLERRASWSPSPASARPPRTSPRACARAMVVLVRVVADEPWRATATSSARAANWRDFLQNLKRPIDTRRRAMTPVKPRADARVGTHDDAAAFAAALDAGNESDGVVGVFDAPGERQRPRAKSATPGVAAPVDVIDLVSESEDEGGKDDAGVAPEPAVVELPRSSPKVVRAPAAKDTEPEASSGEPLATKVATMTAAYEAKTTAADASPNDDLAHIESVMNDEANLERIKEAKATVDAFREAFGACGSEEDAGKEAKRLVRQHVHELRAMFREEWATWARNMVVEQQRDHATHAEPATSLDKPKKTFASAFWSRDDGDAYAPELPMSRRAVKSPCHLNRFRFARDRRWRWTPEREVFTTSLSLKRIRGADAVPSYSYFAYSTHCNSYDREDNFSRLLFRDDDGEFLESDPVEDRSVEDTELSRESHFLLTGVFAAFSKPITLANGPGKPYYDVIRQIVVDELSSALKLDLERVEEWFKEAQRGGESTIRSWLEFRAHANRVNRAMQRVTSSCCIYTADLVSVLKTLGVDSQFWLAFARKIITAPTMAPRTQPVIHFDTFEEAAEQLAGAFCPRCYIFDCRLHGSLQAKSAGRKIGTEERLKRRLSRVEHALVPYSQENPCSATCWFRTDEYKYYAECAATCAPCDESLPSSSSAAATAPVKVDPYKAGRRGWRNPVDQQILVKAVEIIGRDAATPCEVSLFFGTRRGCADVGRQMHHLAMIAEGTDVADDEDMKDVADAVSKKRKRGGGSMSKNFLKNVKGSKHPTIQRRFKMGQNADTVWTQYTPCECEGQCDKGTCPCVKVGNFCERFCNCGPNCWNEFDGCNCKAGARGTCKTGACPCFAAGRECNPDKCRRCCKVADAIVHPIRQKHGFVDKNVEVKMPDLPCENMKLQLRQKEHVCLGRSEIAGWGSYILHGVRKGDFIGEYVGELISQNEADRRGRVYDQNNCSYLFNLNSEWVVDAQNRGNKLRFANHSREANCHARILLVNGDNRLGIYASQDLEPGAELFYDYHYTDEVAPEWHAQDDGGKKAKSSMSAKKSAK